MQKLHKNIKKWVLPVFLVVALVGGFFTVLGLVTPETKASKLFFVQAKGELLLPEGKSTSLKAVNAPVAPNFDWTIVGSIFDPRSKREVFVWWEPTGNDTSNWKLNENANAGVNVKQRALALATTSRLQVAVGSEGVGTDSEGIAWYRTKRGAWEQASSKNIKDASELIKVAVSDSGEVVVLGKQIINEKDVYGLWRSNGGKNYSKLDLELEEGVVLTDVAIGDLGIVTVGTRQKANDIAEGIVWVSQDGTQWRKSTSANFSPDHNVFLNGVAQNSTGFTIVGGIQVDAVRTPRSWVSSDLETWKDNVVFFDQSPGTRISTRGHLVSGVNSIKDVFVSFSDEGFLQEIWRSTDGKSWQDVGNIKSLRATGVPVSDVGLILDGSTILAVAITEDVGIWVFDSETSWRELSFRIDAEEVLPRIEDGPSVNDVVWDEIGQRFIAAGGFIHAQGESSVITEGARFWESTDGRSWSPLSQFHIQERGGPAIGIDNSKAGAVAVGKQDQVIVAGNPNSIDNANPQALYWNVGSTGKLRQLIPIEFPDQTSGFNLYIQSSSLLAVNATNNGAIVGGWAFFGILPRSVDGLVYVVSNGETADSAPSFYIVPPAEIGLNTEGQDDVVTAICSSGDRAVLFGSISQATGSSMVAAVSNDGGRSWRVSNPHPSFNEFGAQLVNKCVAVSPEVCKSTDSIFKDLAPCQGQQESDFFVGVGSYFTQGEANARVWWSVDGLDWNILNLPSELSADGNQQIVDVLVSSKGIVLVANVEEADIIKGRLYREKNQKLERIRTEIDNVKVSTSFAAAAMNPQGQVVVVGVEESGIAKIWQAREPIFN